MDDDFFPFAVTPIISPQRPKPCVPAVEDDSDDEFCMPQASSKPARDPATVAVGSGASLGPQCPTSAKGSVDEGSSLPGGEAASASGDGTAADVNSKVNSKANSRPDQTDFESFPQVRSQKDKRWGSITKEELVWYKSHPALVVPPALHLTVNSDIKIPTHEGVRAYGPNAKDVTPAHNRYVILQYLPLCCTGQALPKCFFEKIRGRHVESVLPYNTIMGKRKERTGEDTKVGPKEVWADTEHHFNTLKKKKSNLTKENWKVAMNWAQKYLDRALELEAEKAEADRLEKIAVEQDTRLQNMEKEGERRNGAVDGAGGSENAGDGDAEAASSLPTELVQAANLKLAPGDEIFFSDPTKIAGTAAAQKRAVILEIRTKADARSEGVGRLVLDRNQIIDDEAAIRKFVKDKKTGEMRLDHRWNIVKRYKLTPGKLEGADASKDRLMDALMADFEKDMRENDYGDLLRTSRRDERQSASDGEDASESKGEGKGAAAIPAARKRGTPVRDSDAGERGGEDSDGDGITASLIARQISRRKRREKGEGSEVVRPATCAKDVGSGSANKIKRAVERTHDNDVESQVKRKDEATRASKCGGGRNEVVDTGTPKKRKLSKADADEVEPGKRMSSKGGDDKVKPRKRKLSRSDSEETEPKKKKLSKRASDEPSRRRSSEKKPSEKPQTTGKSPTSKILSKGENNDPKQRLAPKEKPKAKGKNLASKAVADEGNVPRNRKIGSDEKTPSKTGKPESGQKSKKGEAEAQPKGKSGEDGATPNVVEYSIPKKKQPHKEKSVSGGGGGGGGGDGDGGSGGSRSSPKDQTFADGKTAGESDPCKSKNKRKSGGTSTEASTVRNT
eukprot:jgi/Undpi1/537/HiC_scaffold_10.g04001.m1